MEKLKKLIRFFLGIPVILLSFIFIIKVFLDNRQIILNSLESLNFLFFFAGIFFFTLFFFTKSLIWIEILKTRGYSPNIRSTLFDYGLSEIKRYIPGSIFAVIGRIDSHEKILSKKETLKAIGIEAIILTTSALILSIPAFFFLIVKTQIISFNYFAIIFIIVGLLVATIIFVKFRHVLRYIPPLLLFILAWFLYALGCFFVAISITFLNPVYLVFILSFFTLAWLSGYLIFIAPMGLGVREVVLIYLLSFFTPIGIASVIAVMTRLVMVMAELLNFLLFLGLRNLKSSSRILKIDPPLVLILLLTVMYFILFSVLSIIKHNALLSGRFDLGNMTQTVWNTSQGNIFQLTNPDGIEQISRLGIHSDFILILFAPLYLLWSDPAVLLIIQSFSISLGGIFVYLTAKEIIKNTKISLILASSYFANFWIHQQNLFDFHAVTIATSALLAAFYFLLKKKYLLFFISLFLAVLTKENVFLVSAIFGGYLFLRNKKKLGATLLISSLLIFYFLASYAIPNARGTDHFALSYYAYLGDSPGEMLSNLLFKPYLLFSHLFSLSTLNYFHELFIPTGYLGLLSPLYLFFALPDFAIYLLSGNQNLRTHHYHYGALIIPFIYISTIYSISFLFKRFKKRALTTAVFYYLLVMLIVSCYLYSPLPGMREADYRPFLSQSAAIKKHLLIIPPDASVAASNNIGAQLSHREKIYVLPFGIAIADYIVMHGESKETIGKVDLGTYEGIIMDKKLNFYIFKKAVISNCSYCLP